MSSSTPDAMNAAAVQAREDHRRHDGRFGQQHRAEADFAPPGSAAPAAVPASVVDALAANGIDIEHHFAEHPTDATEMSRSIQTVLDATDEGWTWTLAHASSGVTPYGYLEHPDSNVIVRASVDSLADWDRTAGWEQVASIRDGIKAALEAADRSRRAEAVAIARSVRHESLRAGLRGRVCDLTPISFDDSRVSELVSRAVPEMEERLDDVRKSEEEQAIELFAARIAGRLSAERWAEANSD